MIRPATGNLLQADTDALVNTVNCVGVMGKGIALQFKKAWPEMFRAYAEAVKSGEVVPGKIHVWRTGQLHGPRFILNFPTKRHWRAMSRLEDIDTGLVDLVAKIRSLEIRSIAIPPLGAGNGGLDWNAVRPRVVAALEAVPEVEVLLWDPGRAPAPKDQPIKTKRPEWTPDRAAVIALMGQYRVLDDDLSQLEVQKLAYFLQEAGQDLGLAYVQHHYGPYADRLYHLLQRLEGHFIRGLVDRRPDARLEVDAVAVEEANAIVERDDRVGERFARVSKLIEGFETQYGMELLSSVHWIAKKNPEAQTDVDRAVEALHEWSRRKRSIFAPKHVRIAWHRLREHGWLVSE